jgi:hypothetical protein
MINMTKIRLGAARCPVAMDAVAVHVGSGAKAAFGGGTGVSWVQHRQPVSAARTVSLIPLYTVDNSTGVSAPPERSP